MRLLLSKPDSLGDQLIAAGVVQALQNLQPEWQLVWHVRSGMEAFAPLIDAHVFVPDRNAAPDAEAKRLLATTDKRLVVPYPLSPYEPWTDELRHRIRWWAAFLRATTWDASILGTVNRTWVGDLTATLACAPVRVGFAANAARQPLVNEAQAEAKADAPSFTHTLPPSFVTPEAAQLRDAFAVLEPRLAAIDAVPVWTAAQPWRSPAPAAAPKRIAIAPGVGADTRRTWGLNNLAQIARELEARQCDITWVEGPDDAAFFAEASATLPGQRRRFGRDQLSALAAAIAEFDLLVCHDTAYVHLAAGVGVPTVAIYGAGQDARFQPTGGRVKIVQSEIACSGCQWHCLWSRLHCVADIPVDVVHRAIEDALAGDFARTAIPLKTPLAEAPGGELLALKARLQDEVLSLNADRFARLQIIQTLLAPPPAPNPAPAPSPAIPATSANAEPHVSVIIPMGRPERVAATLQALARQERQPGNWEVIVVGVHAAAAAAAHPQLPIKPVVLARNELPTKTRCLGVEHARGDWLWFVDDDVEPAPDAYGRFLALLTTPDFAPSASKPIGVIGFRLPGKNGGFFERLTDISNFWAQQSPNAEDRDWLYSATFLVRADAYRASGGFNAELPNGEDVDLTRRIVAAGFRLRYEPSLVGRHDHRRDTLTSMWRYFWKNGNAARYFFAHHGGACPFSVKTVWLKAWSDLQMNREFQRRQGGGLGLLAPWVWLNYLIVEASLEYHWQEYIQAERRYLALPARAASDHTFVRAMQDRDAGRDVVGTLRYAWAMLQDFANPVRR